MNSRGKAFPVQEVPIGDIAQVQQRDDGLVEGLVVDGSRGQYQVETDLGLLRCTIRGKLRKRLDYTKGGNGRRSVGRVKVQDRDPVSVGDRVSVLPAGNGSGVIEEVTARGTGMTRGDPSKGRTTSVAGLDQMIAVFSVREPAPKMGLLDRFLVLAESQNLPVVICMNKADLGIGDWLAKRLEVYRGIGYPVVLTSAATGQGIAELSALLGGRTSALVGSSGVGKSSLLNAIQPNLALRVSAISDSTGKGRHTTTGARLCPLDGPLGGYLADTAGIKTLDLAGATAGKLDWCFREFRPFLASCHMSDCSHQHEPDCAIRAQVEAKVIDADRYASYCRLYEDGNDAFKEEWNDAGE